MRFKFSYVLILCILGCAGSKDLPVEKYNYHTSQEQEDEGKDDSQDPAKLIDIIEYEAPEEEISEEGVEEIPVNIVHDQVSEYTVVPISRTFSGGAVVYNYVPNHLYQIFLAPGELTDLILAPGEIITSPPAAGDTLNFMLARAENKQDGEIREHLYLKAVRPGHQTTLVISTDRRIYHFRLIAYERTYMPIVYFQYPMEELKTKRESMRKMNQIIINADVRDLDFSYEIIPHDIHMPRWAPSMVFSDGNKTYINFPSAKRAASNPALFIVEGRKDRVLVNYRVTGDYYIVDQVIDHAELVVDINAGNVITIKRVRDD